MEIYKAPTRPTNPANTEYFSGTVWNEAIITAPDPARIRALRVHFTPGARTAWHTHLLGQTLYVVSGVGRVQKLGEPIREILPGDTVWFGPNEKHWHGAAPDEDAHQLTIYSGDVNWLEGVSDSQYLAPAKR